MQHQQQQYAPPFRQTNHFQDENQQMGTKPAHLSNRPPSQQQQAPKKKNNARPPLAALTNVQQQQSFSTTVPPSLPVFKFDLPTPPSSAQQQPFAFLSQTPCSFLQPWNPFEASPMDHQEESSSSVLVTTTNTPSTMDAPNTNSILEIDSPLDICACAEYAKGIMDMLRIEEQKYYPMNDYIPRHKDINAHMRAVLVDWLNEVAQEYKLRNETLYLAVHYTDRFLSLHANVERSKLQLVGVTCVLIASKYYEAQPPSVDDFVQITDYTYKRDEILKMETLILNALDFGLTVVTCTDFLARFVKAGLAPLLLQPQQAYSVSMFANYLTELSLQEYKMLKYRPSKVAASAMVLSLYTHNCASCWNDTIRHYVAYEQYELTECMQDLFKLHQQVLSKTSSLSAVSDKYSKTKYGRVAQLALPKL